MICTQHHNDTSELLLQVKRLYKPTPPPSLLVVEEKHRDEHHEIRSQQFHGPPLPSKVRRDAWILRSPPHVMENNEELQLYNLKRVMSHKKRSLTLTSNVTLTHIKAVTIPMASLPSPTEFNAKATTGITAKCYCKYIFLADSQVKRSVTQIPSLFPEVDFLFEGLNQKNPKLP